MPTRRGTWSRPCVGRDARKGQGEIPGAEQSASELLVIPGGHAKKAPNPHTNKHARPEPCGDSCQTFGRNSLRMLKA
eukprot:5205058-Prymnesium_polylepis.1